MKIYAIGDLHLSLSVDKPMDIFGGNWTNYMTKIENQWLELITDDDIVLLPGDTSWAISFEEAQTDLEWLDALPGKKIITRGNHDYWWSTLKKMQGKYKTIEFVHNSFSAVGELAICGSRGWISPNDNEFTEQDNKIYNRELHRIELSIQAALKAGYKKILMMLHYPPTNDKKEYSPVQALLEQYPVEHVVYGHLHTPYCWHLSLNESYNNITYHLVASDYLDFKPKKIIEWGTND